MSKNTPTAEQIAAYRELTDPARIFTAGQMALLAPLLPEALKNPLPPLPPLPTEPGTYSLPAVDQAHMGIFHTDGIELHYLNTDGKWVDVGWGNVRHNEKRPFTRLAPERPQVTQDEIRKAVDYAVLYSEIENLPEAILMLMNGTRDE